MEFQQQNTKYSRLKKQLNDYNAEQEKEHQGKSIVHDFLLKVTRKLTDFILYLYRMPDPDNE